MKIFLNFDDVIPLHFSQSFVLHLVCQTTVFFLNRVPFARYVAWNGISLLRRYSIERVYREKKVFGFQPRELYECAFDIVSPSQGNDFLKCSICKFSEKLTS